MSKLKNTEKVIKNYFRILKKPHAYLQTILKTPVKFQKDRTETVGGVKGTKYPLKLGTTHHAPRATHHAPRKTKNSVPPLFFEKAGDNKEKVNIVHWLGSSTWVAISCFGMVTNIFWILVLFGSLPYCILGTILKSVDYDMTLQMHRP